MKRITQRQQRNRFTCRINCALFHVLDSHIQLGQPCVKGFCGYAVKSWTLAWPKTWSKTLQMLGLRPRICKKFSRLTFLGLITLEKFKITLEQIFLTVGQNNYGNKIPDLTVTRGTLWSNNLFKSANIIIFCRTIASLW